MTSAAAAIDLVVVDDDAPTRRYFEIAARGLGLTVRTCATPAQAQELLAAQPVRLVVSDLNLGAERGETLAAHVAAMPTAQRPGFVLMTGGLTPEVKAQFAELGVHRFWPKPVPLDTLRAELALAPDGGAPTTDMPEAARLFFKGNRSLYERYRAQTLPQLLGDLARGDAALAASDLAALAGVLHNLKTVLRLVGRPEDSDAAQALEDLAHGGATTACREGWAALAASLREYLNRECPHG